VLNIAALWKQEPRGSSLAPSDPPGPSFAVLWRGFIAEERTARLLTAIGIGAAAFAMQDALLEPYGGEILNLSVGTTTTLTGAWAAGALTGFCLAGRSLSHGGDPLRLAGTGLVAGITAFLLVLFAAPFQSTLLLFAGALAIGLGLGLFSVGTLTETMSRARGAENGSSAGLALGAWGAVQASCAGFAIALGGTLRDLISHTASAGGLSGALNTPTAGYASVYVIEIILLLAALVALGPLVARRRIGGTQPSGRPFGLREFPT